MAYHTFVKYMPLRLQKKRHDMRVQNARLYANAGALREQLAVRCGRLR
jgi:hypothetical protein